MMHSSRPRTAVAVSGAAALLASLLTPTAAGAADDDPTTLDDLIISEYVEGTSNNKALEIFNGTGAVVDLSGYAVEQYSNGSSSAGLTLDLDGALAAGDVYVLAHASAVSAILEQADQTTGAGLFNGDDALVLRGPDGGVVDSFGQVGVDPGSSWGPPTTLNNTLRRNADVCAGDTDPTDDFDPSASWTGVGTDVFDGLGSHETTCGGGGGTPPAVVINEFSVSTTGQDVEYLEILGAPNTDYSALSVVDVEGDVARGYGEVGRVDSVTPAGTTDAEGRWHVSLPPDTIENGTTTLLLVEGLATEGMVVDADLDGVLDEGLGLTVLDSVAVHDGGVRDLTYSETVLTDGYDGFPSAPGGASRIPDGTDTDTAADWVRNDYDLAGIDGYPGSLEDGEAVNTPGAENQSAPPGSGDLDPRFCFQRATRVGAVQGAGAASPMTGQTVTVTGTVVGDFQHEGSYSGYYVQDPGDGDPATSDGVFVYAPGGTDVSVGDRVRVTGDVTEHYGLTEITATEVRVCATGQELPDALELTMPLGDLEPYEGMLVTFPEELSILEYYNYGRYGEIVIGYGDGTARQHQPTAVFEPGSAGAEALLAHNLSHSIMLDDGLNDQNPAFLRHPNGAAFTLQNSFRGGDLVTGATGVLDYRFDEWGIQPTAPATYTAVTERPEVPQVGGTTTVGSFNVLNYFTTLGSRGADTVEEFERQEAKIVSAINAMDTDVVGLIEIENNGDTAVGTLVDALNEASGSQKWAFVSTGVIGTDEITTAFIYQPAEVAPVGDFAVLDGSLDDRFNDDKNRPALAQTFADLETGGQVTAIVNHLKSKGSDCDALGDPDLGDGQGNCNLTRTAAADALGDWANDDPTGTGTDHVLIIGDLNSYDKEDPIAALAADGYHDLLLEHGGEHAYSYVFDGQLGYLDYAMASDALHGRVTDAQAWNINADEPSVLDYDMTFKPDAQDVLYVPDPYRSSDHDPVLVGLDLSQEGPDTTAPELEVLVSPAHVWPPNNRMVTVDTVVTASDDSGEQPTVTLVGAEVTDHGTGRGGRIVVVSDSRFQVRAASGAVYTLTYEAADAAGNTTTVSVTVEVTPAGNGPR